MLLHFTVLMISMSFLPGAGNHLLDPPPTTLAGMSLGQLASDPACGIVEFAITSPTEVTISFPDHSTCGTGLVVIEGQQAAWEEAGGRTLTLSVRILNPGTQPMQLPVRLALSDTAIEVLQPPGTSAGTVTPLNADTLSPTGGGIWLVGSNGVLAVGDSTDLDSLQFSIAVPTTEARFSFQVSAEESAIVPPQAPDTIPAWVYADSNIVAGSEYLTGLFVGRIVILEFHKGASQSEREEAVSAIGGVVVGGRRMGSDGMYFVKVDDSGDGQTILQAIASLKSLPQVLSATADILFERDERDRSRVLVPPQAPDTIPAWVYADSNIVHGSEFLGGDFVGRIVTVRFNLRASQAERTAAVTAVGGTVVGGRRMGPDGIYFIRVNDSGDAEVIMQAVNALKELPQVMVATPEIFLDWNRQHSRHAPQPGTSPKVSSKEQGNVPPQAPDTIPAWVYADSNIVTRAEYLTGPFAGRIITVTFRWGATQADRQAAIDAVGGTVIGGRRMSSEGIYLVQVNDAGDAKVIMEALKTLNALPQVRIATPEIIFDWD